MYITNPLSVSNLFICDLLKWRWSLCKGQLLKLLCADFKACPKRICYFIFTCMRLSCSVVQKWTNSTTIIHQKHKSRRLEFRVLLIPNLSSIKFKTLFTLTLFSDIAPKDIISRDDLCSNVRWAAKSSVTWLGSPPGDAAHTGHTYKISTTTYINKIEDEFKKRHDDNILKIYNVHAYMYTGLDSDTPCNRRLGQNLTPDAPNFEIFFIWLIVRSPGSDMEKKKISRFPEINSRFPEIIFRFPEINSRFPEIIFRFPEIIFRFPEINSCFPEIIFRFPEINSRFPEIIFRFPEIIPVFLR